ncbi:MAG TPA: hypothetical protein VMW72_01820 [Sedimentisphaerales bacterium]|nr:hypothetical protein [Sedimentisphaerales bacterium]
MDPVNLSILLAYLIKVRGVKIIVSNIDFLFLQSMHGGGLPDDHGVLNIDSIINFAWEQIEENKYMRDRFLIRPIPIISNEASLSMVWNLVETGCIELVDESYGSIGDGMSFLDTKDVDKGGHTGQAFSRNINSKNGLWGDIICWNGWTKTEIDRFYLDLLESKYPHLSLDMRKQLNNSFSDFMSHALWSRLQTIGIAARQGITTVTSDKFFQEHLTKCIALKYPKVNQDIKNIQRDMKLNFEDYTVKDLSNLITGTDTQVRFMDSLYKIHEKLQNQREDTEDLAIFSLNVVFGWIPFVGTGVTVLSYIYKKIRKALDCKNQR